MPNYITNTVKVKDMDVLKEKLLAVDECGNDIVDFNKLRPMPKEILDTIAGGCEWIVDKFGILAEYKNKQTDMVQPLLDSLYDAELTQAEFINKVEETNNTFKFIACYNLYHITDVAEQKEKIHNVLKGYYNLRKYGVRNWYDWSNEYWGTKWNGMETIVDEYNNTISFQTAWACPFPVLEELSKYTDFIVSFADEDTGNNYGIVKFSNGKSNIILDDTNHNIGESYACRFEEIENIEDTYSEYNYTDEEIQEYFKTDRETLINTIVEDFNKTNKLINSLF